MDVILAKPFVLDLVSGSLKGWKRKCGGSWASGTDYKLMNGLRILIAVMKLCSGSDQPRNRRVVVQRGRTAVRLDETGLNFRVSVKESVTAVGNSD